MKRFSRIRSFLKRHRRGILIFFGILLALGTAGAVALNAWLTHYVQSEAFQREMEKETAKGLHFNTGHYEPIRRTGLFTAATDGFEGEGGRKAIVALSARKVTAKFNPWGIFLRRWQLDEVRIGSGEAGIQVYEPVAEPVPAKPWFAIFLPDRVYLKKIICDPADITWQLRGKKSGFFGTSLLVTPNGRDFEYDASGGVMKLPLVPELALKHTHLLITRDWITLRTLDLAPMGKGDGTIHLQGRNGLRDDKSIEVDTEFSKIPITAWLPESWQERFTGIAGGNAHLAGKDTKPENSSGHGTLRIERARIANWSSLQKLAEVTRQPSLETLELDSCALDFEWNSGKIEFKNIDIEQRGKFRIEGTLAVNHKELGGTLRLGVAREYLVWLPDAEKIFTRQEGNYLWTDIHLSGTLGKPVQDLTPRIRKMLEQHPGALLDFFFKQAGDWFEDTFGERK